ncbi:unnamed protein product [Polarella glacialis]|uniref:Uncharacterized protein n=1 Tax=Polarella glacialis TaxID=89957 RepID=A0A813GCJ0_POLGL|nr:unnamed protein product [Polarella glacialis]
MAVGGAAQLVAAARSKGASGVPSPKWLETGQPVQYWSTSKSKWVGAVVKAVDEKGAVQLSVKPRVWVGLLEQAAKVRREPVCFASGDENLVDLSAESVSRLGEPPLAKEVGPPQPTEHTVTEVPMSVANAALSDSTPRQPDRSRALFSLFAGWDGKRQVDSGKGGYQV